ncbi:VOC family protein [Streptomyces sp. PU-14G]|uniref:VOC family protein n=1 Tax=Streptomyces sp. PU-14G TaxID=2800808 RepID=UPI0034DF000C
MPEPVSYPAGALCWADLRTADPASAERFYAAVLGWSYVRTGPAYGHYGYATWQRHMVAGIARSDSREPSGAGERPGADDRGDGGAEASWIVSFATESADALAERVAAAGGEVRHGPEDFGVLGRTVAAVDPEGAHVGFWQARAHLGAGLFGEPSALCWAELAVRDTAAADRFYEAVLGLRATAHAAAGEEHYAAFRLPDEGAGAVSGTHGESGTRGESGARGWSARPGEAVAGRTVLAAGRPGAEPFWMPYFGARDTPRTVDAARREGAEVLYEGVNGQGRDVAVLRDPQGAVFAVLELPAPQGGSGAA